LIGFEKMILDGFSPIFKTYFISFLEAQSNPQNCEFLTSETSALIGLDLTA